MAQSPLCGYKSLLCMKDFLKWLGRFTLPGILFNDAKFAINKLFGTNYSNTYDDIYNGLDKAVSGLSGDSVVDNFIGSLSGKYAGTNLTGAERQQNEYTAMREDTRYQRNVVDMQAAGLNPALMYGSGGSAPSVNSSAGGVAGNGSLADYLQLAMLPLQMQAVQADIEKTKADTENTKADTAGTLLSNEWINAEKQAAIESQRSGIELNDSRISEIAQGIVESKSRISKLLVETEEVGARIELEISQKLLNQANARRIEELLPYEKLLTQAKSEAELASARQAYVHAAYENGLLTSGIIEFSARKEQAESVVADVKAQIADNKYNSSSDSAVDKVCRSIVAGLRRTVMTITGK